MTEPQQDPPDAEVVDSSAEEEAPAQADAPATPEAPAAALVPASAQPPAMFGTDPDALMEKATKVANLLADVIRKNNLSQKIGQKEHVLVEAWEALGTFCSVTPETITVTVIDWPQVELTKELREQRDQGYTFGFTANAVVSGPGGRGEAEADCRRTEKDWRTRGGKPVDDYALKSMAQTRAKSKAFRVPLGWVVSIAGYSATPAEEMPKDAGNGNAQDAQPVRPTPEAARTALGALRYLVTDDPGTDEGKAKGHQIADAVWAALRDHKTGITIEACTVLVVAARALRESRPDFQPSSQEADSDTPQAADTTAGADGLSGARADDPAAGPDPQAGASGTD